jgi:multicomponent Na+:H+ antiporter subunit G
MTVLIGLLSVSAFGIGMFSLFATTVGMLRFPDAYTRLHAGTKGLTIGAGFIVLGAVLAAPSVSFGIRSVVIGVFLLVTNPIATHAIARACYRSGAIEPVVVLDEYEPRVEADRDAGEIE